MHTAKELIRVLEFEQGLSADGLEAIQHERSPAYSERVNEYYRKQNRKSMPAKKPLGKLPYQYFLVPSFGRREAFLQHWIRYYEDSFDEPDRGYSLHVSLEALTKFYDKENKVVGGLRKILPCHNPALVKPEKVYVDNRTYELVSRKSKGTSGIAVTTYIK